MNINPKASFFGCLLLALVLMMGCGEDTRYYTMEDFAEMEKIDAHVHVNSSNSAFLEQAEADNFKLLTINTDYPDFPPIEEQMGIAVHLKEEYPNHLAFASTFHMTGWDNPDWQKTTIRYLDSTFQEGAIAVKVWKNIGMSFRDEDSNLVMINDQQFDPVFSYLQERNVPLIGHLGEPKNCWLPVEEMTVNNDKEYFENHPQYHMYLHTEMPSYERQMAVRDSMLEKNRNLVFMGAHLASLEWSMDTLVQFLVRFPNAVVDMAARMGQVQYQSSENHEHVRQFFIDYQDRVLYATDLTFSSNSDSSEFRQEAHKKWIEDWKYLTTADTMEVPELDHKFTGLRLPSQVIDKIYRLNAERTFPGAWGK